MAHPATLPAMAAATAIGLVGCTLLMPSDDELRGKHGSSGGGTSGGGTQGGGASSGSGGGGSGGVFGGGGAAGAPAPCGQAADFDIVTIPVAGDATRPLVVHRSNDVAVVWVQDGRIVVRPVALDGSLGTEVELYQGAAIERLAVAWSEVTKKLGAVWMDSTLMFGALGSSPATKPVYGSDPTLPAGKAPKYAVVAADPKQARFGIVWSGYGDSAERLYAVVVDDAGAVQTPGDGYTRLTDPPSCGAKRNPSLIGTASGFALVWADNIDHCTGSYEPDVRFTTLGADLATPASDQAIAAAAGVSDFPALAWGGSDYGLAWIDDRESASAVWFARVAGAGMVESSLSKLSTGKPNVEAPPGLAGGPSGYGAAWQEGGTVHFSVLKDPGAPSDVVLSQGAAPGKMPSVAWAGSKWVIAWVEQGTAPGIRVAFCAPG